MYLATLNSEEKKLFLSLAYHLASSDGNYSFEEEVMILGYCNEMGISFGKELISKDLDYIFKEFMEKSSLQTKKIIVFEAIGLAISDKKYDAEEREMILKMQDLFHIEKTFVENCERILDEYIEFQNRVNEIVLG